MKKTRILYKRIKSSSFKKIEAGFDTVGFGYIIIPSDIDRDAYIKEVYGTGYCMIITSFNEPVKDVIIPPDILHHLTFPTQAGEYGQLVSWICHEKTNQLIITNILMAPGQVVSSTENVYVTKRELGDNKYSKIIDLNNSHVSEIVSNDKDEKTSITIKAKNSEEQSHVKIENNKVTLVSENIVQIIAEKEFNITIGDEKGVDETILSIKNDGTVSFVDMHGNTIDVKKDNFKINSTKITLGDSNLEPAVLGNKLKGLIEELISAIGKLTVPTAMGPSGIPVNIAEFQTISGKLSTILSKKNEIE